MNRPRNDDAQVPSCTASGDGWACNSTDTCALGLCHAHYQQQRRGEPLRPVRARGGLVRVGAGERVSPETAEALNRRARELKLPVYQVIARILESWAKLPTIERDTFVTAYDNRKKPRRKQGADSPDAAHTAPAASLTSRT